MYHSLGFRAGQSAIGSLLSTHSTPLCASASLTCSPAPGCREKGRAEGKGGVTSSSRRSRITRHAEGLCQKTCRAGLVSSLYKHTHHATARTLTKGKYVNLMGAMVSCCREVGQGCLGCSLSCGRGGRGCWWSIFRVVHGKEQKRKPELKQIPRKPPAEERGGDYFRFIFEKRAWHRSAEEKRF